MRNIIKLLLVFVLSLSLITCKRNIDEETINIENISNENRVIGATSIKMFQGDAQCTGGTFISNQNSLGYQSVIYNNYNLLNYCAGGNCIMLSNYIIYRIEQHFHDNIMYKFSNQWDEPDYLNVSEQGTFNSQFSYIDNNLYYYTFPLDTYMDNNVVEGIVQNILSNLDQLSINRIHAIFVRPGSLMCTLTNRGVFVDIKYFPN